MKDPGSLLGWSFVGVWAGVSKLSTWHLLPGNIRHGDTGMGKRVLWLGVASSRQDAHVDGAPALSVHSI